MRKGLLVLTLVAFAYFVHWKVAPFLHGARPDVVATPVPTAADPSQLALIDLKRGQEACVGNITFAADARRIDFTIKTRRAAGRLRVRAQAPGYRAGAEIPPGTGTDQVVSAAIAPPPRDVAGGTFCVQNAGRHALQLYGIDPASRAGAPVSTSVDGRKVKPQLSVALLSSPSRSLWAQRSEIYDRIAAFRPVGAWFVMLTALLVLVGLPVAVGVAVARAAADDDRRDEAEAAAALPAPHPRGGW